MAHRRSRQCAAERSLAGPQALLSVVSLFELRENEDRGCARSYGVSANAACRIRQAATARPCLAVPDPPFRRILEAALLRPAAGHRRSRARRRMESRAVSG